jgi:transposase
MQKFQLSLLYDYQSILFSSSFHRKYDALFSALDLTDFSEKNTDIGRTGYSRHAILRAFIVKHLEEIKSIPRLIEFLDAHPILTEMCGFKMGVLPDESQFYRFLKETPNGLIQDIMHKINKVLIEKGIVTLDTFAIDSKPVKAATRENNHKNQSRNLTDKNKIPRRNPQATLGYFSYHEKKTEKKL